MLYDGFCGFCNGTVQWLLKHDKLNRFQFAPQQSEFATEALRRHGVARDEMLQSNSVYLILNPHCTGERLLMRSDVLVEALHLLSGGWRWLGMLLQAIPRPLRDWGYTLIARNRYRITGRYDACPLPSKQNREKFLGW